MKIQSAFIDFILKEWLVIASAAGLIITSLYTRQIPLYSMQEIEVLFVLLVLFIAVNGLQRSGIIAKIAQEVEQGRFIPLKLTATAFFLSMLITNDAALIIIVPLTLSLNITRKDILVILEALAANSGSALTPIGNPQNLFIYWFYNVPPEVFIKTIAPFSMFFFALLIFVSLFLKIKSDSTKISNLMVDKSVFVYGILLSIVLLTVLHILPVSAGIIVILFALLFDRGSLRVDYPLLFSFLFFFGIAANLKTILTSQISHSEHIFIFSALASQLMSNVPATLLFAKFTSNWSALLWGVSAGGFGSLFGSLANLIAYKIYITRENAGGTAEFTAKFLILGYLAFALSIGLYLILFRGTLYLP